MRTNTILILWAGLSAMAAGQTMNMQAIAQALGVSCDYCHMAERGHDSAY